MNGLINLNKPAGISSAAAVRRVKRLLPPGTRIDKTDLLPPLAAALGREVTGEQLADAAEKLNY